MHVVGRRRRAGKDCLETTRHHGVLRRLLLTALRNVSLNGMRAQKMVSETKGQRWARR